jgi:LacI family transcriptional regulator
MIGRAADNQGVTFVDLDSAEAMEAIMNHLVQLGHRRIGFVCYDDQDFGYVFRLLQAYRKSCANRGLPALEQLGSLSDEAGYRAMGELLERDPELTSVIVWSDVVTSGVIRMLSERQLVIPRDISIASFDRSTQLRLDSSDLTVIDTRAEEVGTTAARMLLDILNGRTLEQRQVLVAPRLLVGESTAPPALNGHFRGTNEV